MGSYFGINLGKRIKPSGIEPGRIGILARLLPGLHARMTNAGFTSAITTAARDILKVENAGRYNFSETLFAGKSEDTAMDSEIMAGRNWYRYNLGNTNRYNYSEMFLSLKSTWQSILKALRLD